MPISFLFFRKRKRNEVLHSSNAAKERKRKTVGRRAPAGKYGNIPSFFVRKKFRHRRKGIFVVTHTYVRTNATVSQNLTRVTHSVRSGVVVFVIT